MIQGRWGGGAKKFAVSPFFCTPPPRGHTAQKTYPTPMCKKVSQPQFFSNERHNDHPLEPNGCHFIRCKCSLHNALRSPNVPQFVGINWVALHVSGGPKFRHQKVRVLAVGPQEFWLGVNLVKMTFRVF